jgi:soluble lytic murein transglycosylase-like protein
MQEISNQTGIQFSEMFARKLNTAAQTGQITEEAMDISDDEIIKAEAAAETAVYTNGSKRGDYDALISEASQRYGLDFNLVRAVVWAESNFDPNVVSSAGAMGLMQLMPGTAASLGVVDAFNPEQNIDGGAKYLASRLELYNGDVMRALAAYNCGAGRLASREITDLNDPDQFAKLPKETRTYLNRIENYLESLGVKDILL